MSGLIAIILSLFINVAAWSSAEDRIVIYWAPFGGGHLAAAKALQKAILAKDPTATVVLKDFSEFMNPVVRKVSLKTFDTVTRNFGDLFDLGYQAQMLTAETVGDARRLPNAMLFDLTRVSEDLRHFKPTAVVSTFMMATQSLARLREKKGLPSEVKLIWQHTDYALDPFYQMIAEVSDMTFMPEASMTQDWIDKGISQHKLLTTGIPIDPDYLDPVTSELKKSLRAKNGLDPELKTILLLNGAGGLGDYTTQVKSLARTLTAPIQIVAVTGKNTKELQQLGKMGGTVDGGHRLIPFGFLPNETVAELLKASDLFIGKAGALVATQVNAVGVPAVFFDSIGGQERSNIEFFVHRGTALSVRDESEVGSVALRLLQNPGPRVHHADFLRGQRPDLAASWILQESEKTRKLLPLGADFSWGRSSFVNKCQNGVAHLLGAIFRGL